MSIQWRPTLVQMQTALKAAGNATLPLSASTEGYSLVASLLTTGTAYDAIADDGVNNPSAFAATVEAYVSQAGPTFLELDRFSRYVFANNLTSSLMTPECGLAFGVITDAQSVSWQEYVNAQSAYDSALAAWIAGGSTGTAPVFNPPVGAAVPQLTPATALTFDRTYSTATQGLINGRSQQAGLLLAPGAPDAVTLASASRAWYEGSWYDTDESSHSNITPPTNPSPSSETASMRATGILTITLENCESWLAATAFQ